MARARSGVVTWERTRSTTNAAWSAFSHATVVRRDEEMVQNVRYLPAHDLERTFTMDTAQATLVVRDSFLMRAADGCIPGYFVYIGLKPALVLSHIYSFCFNHSNISTCTSHINSSSFSHQLLPHQLTHPPPCRLLETAAHQTKMSPPETNPSPPFRRQKPTRQPRPTASTRSSKTRTNTRPPR